MEDKIRLERYIWMARASNCTSICNYTSYIRIPSEIRHALRERYNIDLTRDWKKLLVETVLAEEISDGRKEVVIVHKFHKLPGVK